MDYYSGAPHFGGVMKVYTLSTNADKCTVGVYLL